MKKSKFMKILVIFVLIFSMLYIQMAPVQAGLLDNAKGESGPKPPPPTPPDDPGTPSTPSTPGPSGPTIIEVPHYTKIEGKVREDVGEISIGTNGNDSQTATIGIPGVTVNLMQGETVVDSQITGSDGSYSFSPEPGTYSLEFIYGSIDGKDLNNTDLIRKTLRYNGHDYITVETPGNQDYTNVTEYEIRQSGRGSAQVYLAVDCSRYMRDTLVTVNGETKSRLEVEAEAAKKLIDKLLNSGENIYVGLVFFSGTNYRAKVLTKNEQLLYMALDNIVSNNWETPNTDITSALDKVKNSYANNEKENSNRYLAILSDGIPTKDATIDTQTYYDATDEENMEALEKIKESTTNKVKELKEDGVKIFSLMVEGEPDENEWAKEIFGLPNSDVFLTSKDGDEMVTQIKEDLQEYVFETLEEKSYTSGSIILSGHEDAERRAEVDSNFETFKYDNTVMFEQIYTYNATEEDKAKAQELSEKTWMRVVGGQNYTIDEPVPDPSEIVIERDEEGNPTVIERHVERSYSNQNVILAQRPALSLVTQTTATGLKITLADGQVLTEQTREVGTDLPMIQSMDEEISHGATLQIEYTICIKNDSSIQCNYLELINYLPSGFMFSKDMNLITEDTKNSDYGWNQVASMQELKDTGYISQGTLDGKGKSTALTITLDNAGQGENGFYIPPGGDYNTKVIVSKVISSLNDIESALVDTTEVLVYKNSSNRRMAYLKKYDYMDDEYGALNIGLLWGVFPGDSKDQDCSEGTNLVFVIPPTGRKW